MIPLYPYFLPFSNLSNYKKSCTASERLYSVGFVISNTTQNDLCNSDIEQRSTETSYQKVKW